jgi:regulator of replication initiation timing
MMSFPLKFEEDVIGYEGKIEDGSQKTIVNLEKQIEELKDHKLDMIIEEEVTMHILNLTLQEQLQNVLEGLFSEDDDYADWIRCATAHEDAQML